MGPSLSTRRLIGVLLFDDVEVLDFAGPIEVFSGTSAPDGEPYVDVTTVGPAAEITTRGVVCVSDPPTRSAPALCWTS